MSDLVTAIALLLGGGFMLLSAVGVVRMPDVYMRLQVASKASSLGAGLVMLAVAIHFAELGITVRALLVVAFIFLTTPVSAHLLGRAAYLTGVPLWRGSGDDALRGSYDPEHGTLAPRAGGWRPATGEPPATRDASAGGEPRPAAEANATPRPPNEAPPGG